LRLLLFQIQSVRLCSSKETDISNRVLECIRQFDKLGAKSAEVWYDSAVYCMTQLCTV